MQRLFFYGLFMDEDLLKKKGISPSKPAPAFVDGFGLKIGERATLVKSDGERAYGVLMSLSGEDINRLYSERSVSDYLPETIMATTLDNQSVSAVVYNLPLEKLVGRNKQYAESFATLAKEVGLPADYVIKIQQFAK